MNKKNTEHQVSSLAYLTLGFPVAWVLACYDGMWRSVQSGEYLRALWTLVAAVLAVGVLLVIGGLFACKGDWLVVCDSVEHITMKSAVIRFIAESGLLVFATIVINV